MAAAPGPFLSTEIAQALAAWPGLVEPCVARIPVGLIHESYSVRAGGREWVLQRVNPIFDPGIHENIRAVTEHLHAKGVATLRLVRTDAGRPYADLGPGRLWRLLTRMPGTSFEICSSPDQARAAGALVARFHSALADLEHAFRPLGIPLHDTEVHLARLEQALVTHPGHRLHAEVALLADEILAAARAWEPIGPVPARVVHGDLKFNNVLFAGEAGADRSRALSLIDLDTVSPMPLWVDLGDAWRSWCNRRGEDCAQAELDLDLWLASVEGYLGALSIELGAAERAALAHGLERSSLELAARFAADVLCESYFGWDATRFPSRADHNLVRAQGQLSLHRQAHARRDAFLRRLGA